MLRIIGVNVWHDVKVTHPAVEADVQQTCVATIVEMSILLLQKGQSYQMLAYIITF